MDAPIPDDVLELLRTRVASIEQLEALLLLHREVDRQWSVEEIGERLSLPAGQLAPELDALVRVGMLARSGRALDVRWQYAPRDAASDAMVVRLAAVYAVRRLEVLRLLNDLALQRIRGSAARAFADSFVIGRKKDG